MPVNKLLLSVSLPIMISMTIQALYNVIDSIFVSKLGEDAFNAVSLAFPVQNLIISAAVGISVGMNALLGRRLGEKNTEKANQTAMNGLFITTIGGLIFLIFGFFGVNQYFSTQTDHPVILAYGLDYLPLICIFSITTFYGIAYERLLQATGRTVYTMTSQGVGAVVNIILDPILIFGLLGCPRLEVLGAAIATVIGSTTTMALNMWFHTKRNPEISLPVRGFRPDGIIIRDVSAIAIPSMAMGSVTSVLVYGLNGILMTFSATGVAVLGIYYKMQSFIFMAVYGLCNGMVPILSYNFGAKDLSRMVKTILFSLLYGISICVAGCLLYWTCATQLITLFQDENASPDLMEIGVPALRTIATSFPFAGFSIIMSSVFQALGHGMMSLVGSVVRQLVILLPCAYILGQNWGLGAVWYAFPLSEVACLAFFFWCGVKIYRQDMAPLKAN